MKRMLGAFYACERDGGLMLKHLVIFCDEGEEWRI